MIVTIIDKIEDYRRFLNDLYKNANHKDENDKCLNAEQNKVIDDIEKEIKEVDSGWIPCRERMPEEREWIGTKAFGTTISDTILITFKIDDKYIVEPMRLQNGTLSISDKQKMDVFPKKWEMIAWQPLPEPYKESEEE